MPSGRRRRLPAAGRLLAASAVTAVVATWLGAGALAAPTLTLAPGDELPTLTAGARVILAPGTYRGPWTVEAEGVVIEGAGATLLGGAAGSTLVLAAPGIRVSGLTVAGAGPEEDLYAPDAGLWLVGCHDCRVAGVSVTGAPTGLRVEDSDGVIVSGARLDGGSGAPGLTVFASARFRLEDSTVRGFLDGIYLEGADDAAVVGSEFVTAARYALHSMYSANTTLAGNVVRGGAVGSAAMYGRGLRATGNTFEGHVGPLSFGLLALEVKDAVVAGNTFVGNTIGALVVSAPDVTLERNLFTDGGFGVLVQRSRFGGTSAVRLHDNVFTGNVSDVAVDDDDASVELRSNAFEGAPRLDRDGDGVVDVPHVPSSSYAMLASRQPDLSLYALSPGVVLWESIEATVPAVRLMTLADPTPRTYPSWSGGPRPPGSTAHPAGSVAGVLGAVTLVAAGLLLARPRGLPAAPA